VRPTLFLEYWDFCANSVNKTCNFLNWLAWDTHEFKTGCSDSYIPPPCIFTHAPHVYKICSYSDHDSNSFPYYISDDGFAKLTRMIETMNEQQVKFTNKMREYDLSHETDLRFSSPRLDVYLCNDGASYPPLESGLEAEFDPLLTTPFLIASS